MFRSIDINAPTPQSGFMLRPDPSYGRIRQMQPEGLYLGNGFDISYRGMWNKYFSGFGRYTWAHYESNTGGITWFPENQLDPGEEWSNSGYDRRQRVRHVRHVQPEEPAQPCHWPIRKLRLALDRGYRR